MLKRLCVILGCSGTILSGCAPPGSPLMGGDPTPAVGPGSNQVNYWRQKAAADRAACRDAMMRSRAAGVSRSVINQQWAECNENVGQDATMASQANLERTSPIAAETLKTEIAARAAMQQGRTDEAMALYRQIDANGPAIIAEIQVSQGGSVSSENTLRQNLDLMDKNSLLLELARAQRILGQYDEAAGQDRAAATWYEKANATMAIQGGRDLLASDLLGFMYAYGRGVPQDRERAMALFRGSDPGFLGLQGKNETAMAWLLRTGNLPHRMQDVTPEYIDKVADQQVRSALTVVLLVLQSSSSQPRGSGGTGAPFNCAEQGAIFGVRGAFSAMQGCSPRHW